MKLPFVSRRKYEEWVIEAKQWESLALRKIEYIKHLEEELSKYRRPRDPKTGRFVKGE